MDAALESCAAAVLDVVKTLRNVTGSLESEIESAASSPTTQSEDPGDGALADALPDKPPSRWVACDLCEKWRRVPWHASIEIDENTSLPASRDFSEALRHRCDSHASGEALGGLVFDFEPFRMTRSPRREHSREREREQSERVAAMA